MLEAAKALVAQVYQSVPWVPDGSNLADRCAAVVSAAAREEAKPADFWQHCLDRAQQAEADLRWHRRQCEMLSEMVAEQVKRADAAEQVVASFCGPLHGAFSNCGPSHDLKPFMPTGESLAQATLDAIGVFKMAAIAAEAAIKAGIYVPEARK